MTTDLKTFTVDVDADGIATFRFDVPGRTMNTFTDEAVADLDRIVARIRDDAAIRGAILASGKNNGFCAGADLGDMESRLGLVLSDAEKPAELERSAAMSRSLRALETVGKPVVAALEGLALGGGFEFALAAHRRIASKRARVGLPEVTIGLLPGAGGTQRVPRLAGLQAAFDFVISGTPVSAEKALAMGIVDEVVEPGEAEAAARRWILGGGVAVAPWDAEGFIRTALYAPENIQTLMNAIGGVHAKSYGNYPAQRAIARAIYEGANLPMDRALDVEARLFMEVLQTPEARAMVRSIFLSRQALAKGDPKTNATTKVVKATVLGAGMMGAGIAYAQAAVGIETVLIDVSQDAVDRGKDYSRSVTAKAVKAGATTQAVADALVARITATTDFAEIAGSDLVVEAVFEDRAVKADVTARAEAVLAPDAVFASNTSTLPIDGLADASGRPENFIGIHFFSPVDRMELVEVIKGKRTSPETVAKAVAYCRQLRKVPIVVNDSRGFYTSRVFEEYNNEGTEMLLDGIAPAIIDNVGRMTGMPRGPLELLDDVAIDLVDRIFRQRRIDLGQPEQPTGVGKVLHDMVQAGRLGRKNGNGFYDYPEGGGQKRLWPGLAEMYPVSIARSSPELIENMKRRLLYRQAVEAARCIDENVVMDPRDADVGALLGWNFAKWTGGPISLIDRIGVGEFVKRCDELAVQCGPRFSPPDLLRRMAAEGKTFYPRPSPGVAKAA